MPKVGRGGEIGALLGRSIKQDRTIKGLVKRTQNLKKEQYRIIDADGNVVLEKKGDKHSVAATVGEKRDFLKGNISLHNHPEGGTFSAADFSDFGYGAREIVAATPEVTYRLINKKYGTKEAYDGWVNMRDGADQIPQASTLALLQQARKNLENSATKKELDRISSRWAEIYDKEGKDAANAYHASVRERYDALTEKHKQEVKQETRRLETEPFHEYYKAHAAENGFIYRFEKKPKKK